MGKLEKKLKALLEIGDVELYKTVDGEYGISLDLYDNTYGLSHPAKTIKKAVDEMHDEEWRVQEALKLPAEYWQIAYQKKFDEMQLDALEVGNGTE